MSRLPLLSNAARAMNAARKTFGGGRPQSDAERCPCGKDTLVRAQKRASKRTGRCPVGDGHERGCPFAHVARKGKVKP